MRRPAQFTPSVALLMVGLWPGGRLTLPLDVPVADAQGTPKRWVIVFNQPNGLPANADRIVTDAGGTITVRLPEIGAVAATSSNANFAAAVAAQPSVRAVSEDIEQKLIPDLGELGARAVAVAPSSPPSRGPAARGAL